MLTADSAATPPPPTRPLSVAMLVGQFPLLSESFVLNQITGLIERGHSVDVYAINGPSDPGQPRHPDVDRYRLMDRVRVAPELPGTRARRAWQTFRWLWLAGPRGVVPALRSLTTLEYRRQTESLKLLAGMTLPVKTSYDVIHCQFGTFGLMGMELRELGALSGKLVVSFRGFDISMYPRVRGRHVYDRLFQAADAVLTNCDYFKFRLLALGCEERRITVVRTGLDLRLFPFSPARPLSSGRVRIATVGRFVEKKGFEYLIHAVSRLTRAKKCVECVIVGYGPLGQYLRRLVDDLDLQDVVTFAGPKTHPEISEILRASHIFAAPSVTALNGDEDAAVNVLKEAMALGLPVVSTYHGGIPELVEDGVSGFLVPERDIEALAERLAHLVETPSLWGALGRAGRERVEQFYNLQIQNDRLVDVYRQVLGAMTFWLTGTL